MTAGYRWPRRGGDPAPRSPAAARLRGLDRPARQIAQRLRAQQLAASACAGPGAVVSRLLAVQAQDPLAARWAVGVRLAGDAATEAAVDRALAEGTVLRTHVMRWTWQLVCPADLRWLLALVGPRLDRRYLPRRRELGLDARVLRRSRTALKRALRDGQHLTREELAAALARARLPSAGPALSHLLGHAELRGLLCGGAPRGKAATWALLELRAPEARPVLPREEALAELAGRYFESRGPATVADLAWWAGLTAADARAGIEGARRRLVPERVDGETSWRGADPGRATGAGEARRALLLPPFDEYLVAYRDRRLVLDPGQARRVNAGGGMLGPCVVLDGRVVGTWRRTLRRGVVEIELDLFERQPSRVREAVEAAAARYARFLGLPARVTGLRLP
jgi:hypothetical protein